MSIHLQREIDRLKRKLLHLSASVEDAVRKAVRALETRDADLAGEVVATDERIDQMEVDVEEDCLKILALHQPVAIDLRFIITVLKINNDLERVGDLAVNIAERTVSICHEPPTEVRLDFARMCELAQSMLHRALDALITLDSKLAREVCASDDGVDECNREMYALVKEGIRRHPDRVNVFLHLISVSRHLERIGDHATNIAEDVIYMVEGRIVRHRHDVPASADASKS